MRREIKNLFEGTIASDIAIIDYNDFPTSYGTLRRNVERYSHLFETLSPTSVMISHRSDALNIATFLACLNTGVNFSLMPYEKNHSVIEAKCGIANTDLLLSDYTVHEFILTVDPTGINEVRLPTVKILGGHKYVDSLRKLVDSRFNLDMIPPTTVHNNPADVTMMSFHRGASAEAFKFSGFSLEKVLRGLNKGGMLGYESDVVFLERFEMVYDIINGILAPLSRGYTVKFARTDTYEQMLSSISQASCIYSGAYTFEKLLETVDGDISNINTLKKHPHLKFVRRYLLRKKFKREVGKLDRIILTGKIRKIDLINALKVPVTTLYTMAEVASFIALQTHEKLSSVYSVGKVSDRVEIVSIGDGHQGGIFVYTDDLAAATNASYVVEKFMHNRLGRLNTRDIGYIKDGELYVIDKDVFVYEYVNGQRVDTALIINRALEVPYIKDAMLVSNHNTDVTLLVEPDVEFCTDNDMSLDDIKCRLTAFEYELNKDRNGGFHVSVCCYTDKDGLNRQTYSIVSRGLSS